MHLRAPVILSLIATLLLVAGTVPSSVAQNRTTQGTESLAANGTVVIENHEGSITIDTWDREEVQYEAVVRPERDAEHPEATVVRVDADRNRFSLRTDYDEGKAGDGWDWMGGQSVMPVAYTLTVPRTARVEIDDHESDIQVRGLRARLTVDTHDGTVRLSGHQGNAEIASHDGPIRIKNHDGTLRVDTHDGDIRLRSVEGSVAIESHDSEIDAEGLRGRLRVESHGGGGRFAFAALNGRIEIDTHDGDFTLAIPEGAGFDLQTDFNDDAILRADVDLSPYRISDDDDDGINYSGRVHGGGPRISLTAHDGSFEIRRQ